MTQGIEYWQMSDTKELCRIRKMLKNALERGFKVMKNDTVIEDIETILKKRGILNV